MPPKRATLVVIALGVMTLLAPPYLLSAQEAFTTKSDGDCGHDHDKKHDNSKDDIT